MGLKSRWLDKRHIRLLRRDLEYVGSDELKEELDDYIENEDGGAYICNLLTESSIRELESLREQCIIMALP